MSRTIPLTNGGVTIVSDEDYDELSRYRWSRRDVSRVSYAGRSIGSRGNVEKIWMHRIIAGAKSGELVDHANCDGLDNRRSNVRICTKTENQRNIPKISHRNGKQTTSQYKGVYWDSRYSKWRVGIAADRAFRYLGSYDDERIAALVYDKAARELHKDFAWLNFPDVTEYDLPEYKPTSEYRGVHWDQPKGRRGKWKMTIFYDGRQRSLGRFDDEEEAAKAYDEAAKRHHGSKARLNFP